MELGKWLEVTNTTQNRFASMIGTSRCQVHKYLTGEDIPGREMMLKIFEVTGEEVTPNDFFGIVPEFTFDTMAQTIGYKYVYKEAANV